MRHFLFFVILSVLSVTATASYAFDDGFGDRFYNQAPQALGEYKAEDTEMPDIAMDDFARELQEIQPASGEEELATEDEVQVE